ncbi:MAG TPA: RND transporter, partial [Rhizobiales bacterium]|nr:RND transporter [Hyphomicrobiales bacterium]
MAKRNTRPILSLFVVALLGAGLTWSFWPRPLMVDIGNVQREPMIVTIDEDGRTRV